MRKHDIEEFSEIVRRHGTYKRDLENFARALNQSKQGTIIETDDEKAARVAADPKVRAAVEALRPKPGSGIESVTLSTPGREPVTLVAKGRES
jgi:hypothetical protein